MTRSEKYLARIAELKTVAELRRAADFALRDDRLSSADRKAIESAAFAKACGLILAEGARRRRGAAARAPESTGAARVRELAHR